MNAIDKLRGKYVHARKNKSKHLRLNITDVGELVKEINELETLLMEKPTVVEKIVQAPPIIIRPDMDGGSF